jgi:hypothetical protein
MSLDNRNKRNQLGRGSFTSFQRAARMAEIAQHQRIAEAVVVATTTPN